MPNPLRRHGGAVSYFLALLLPLAAIYVTYRLTLPAFVFEHIMVLLVVGLALLGGRGPAILVAIVGSAGDNVLLRAPIGQPAIHGVRDVLDLVLFLVVAATVGWLVTRLREAKETATRAAARERQAREERDRLIDTVSHDLATPLGAIQGTIRVARQHANAAAIDLPRLFARIDTAAGRATSLLRTLADMRSLDEAGLGLTLQPADLRSVVEQTVRMLDQVSERHVLSLAMTSTPLPLVCDVERLGRAVENLIANAVKYSPDGGPIHVSVGEESGAAVMRVADTGIGIPDGEHERIFQPGYRTENAASVAPGLGLGLFIATAIVERHGGTLSASARAGGGSVFTMRLPLAETTRPAENAAGAETPDIVPYERVRNGSTGATSDRACG